jgi:hypothetical protein
MTTWNISKSDGHYIGQSKALNAEVAFCQYMPIYYKRLVDPEDVTAEELEPGVCEIKYYGETFILRAVT